MAGSAAMAFSTSSVTSVSSSTGDAPDCSTVTLTSSFCTPPPLITPRSGVTSEKSRPQAIVMCSMDGKQGDYPGVARLSERALYEGLCPDPNLILNCRHLA